MSQDHSQALQAQVLQAVEDKATIAIQGGGSKNFYGRKIETDTAISTLQHHGVVDYEPTELVITARSGSRISDIEAVLAEQGQSLPFEPAQFGGQATIGGSVASGLSGPARPFSGAVRDLVLGTRVINGRGEILSFGGQVMKNVAGYDISRLQCGAMGTLGLILDVSFKVLPVARHSVTVTLEQDEATAIELMNRLSGEPLPLSAAMYQDKRLCLRLSGAEQAVEAAQKRIGGDLLEDGDQLWQALREYQLPIFQSEKPLWRLSILPAAAPLDLPGEQLIDWGGAQRWLSSEAPAEEIQQAAAALEGHAMLFRGGDRQADVFQKPSPISLGLHQRIKKSMDPDGLFNPGRLYRDL